jgi:hypothetical protein
MLMLLLCSAAIAVVFLIMCMDIIDPMLSRLGEVRECLQRLENIRRIQKEMHDLGHEWWMQDLMRQRDEWARRDASVSKEPHHE